MITPAASGSEAEEFEGRAGGRTSAIRKQSRSREGGGGCREVQREGRVGHIWFKKKEEAEAGQGNKADDRNKGL